MKSPVRASIISVPGIGPAARRILANIQERPIQIVSQLIFTFNTLREPQMDILAHCDAFYCWLHKSGIYHYRHDITFAVALKAGLGLER